MQFKPFVLDSANAQIPVSIQPMAQCDAASTNLSPVWQPSWTSDYLADIRFDKYAAKVGDELIALAAHEILDHSLIVHVVPALWAETFNIGIAGNKYPVAMLTDFQRTFPSVSIKLNTICRHNSKE